MAEPLFDKEGNLQNADELTVDEVVSAYQGKNKQIFARVAEATNEAKAAKEAKDALEIELKKLKETPPKPEVSTESYATKEELADIRLGSMGYDEETIGYIKALAKGKGVGTFDVLDEPLIKGHVEAKKLKEEIANATPMSSGRTLIFNDKPLHEMSQNEKLQVLRELGEESAKNIRSSNVVADKRK